jgi:hypothetical protein
LADRQASAGQNDENAFARLHELMHLAAGIDLIESSVGTGIGGQNQAFFGHDAQAISHDAPQVRKM